MNRPDLIRIIAESYAAAPEYLWAKHPHYAVFRHAHNRKWFALLADVPPQVLGIQPTENHWKIDILNLKADPVMVGNLRQMDGIFPAYHMNKEHWVSVRLDGALSDEDILNLIADSFALTK